jgi:hypothetical protein
MSALSRSCDGVRGGLNFDALHFDVLLVKLNIFDHMSVQEETYRACSLQNGLFACSQPR